MLILLLFLTWLSLLLLFARRAYLPADLRLNLLLGWAVWGGLLTLLSELASLFNALNRLGLAIGWGIALLGVLVLLRSRHLAAARVDFNPARHALHLADKLLLAGVGLAAALSGVIAVQAAPNNWDSMVYHLSRVMHWLQNDNLNFYPTHILRQLYLNPWSEYAHANLYALGSGDRFLNLLQWFSGLGALLGVSLLARQMGARPAGQALAVVFTASLPMTILQMSSTQNDLAAAFWLVCFAVFLLEDLRAPSLPARLGIGLSLGLAVLTKSTVYLFAFPLVVLYAMRRLRRQGWSFLAQLALIAALALAVNLPHYVRNLSAFGSPLGPAEETRLYRNDRFGLDVLASNLSRNFALHLVSFSPVNQAVQGAVEGLHGWLGMNINDPATTWEDHQFRLDRFVVNEDFTGAPLHLGLLGAALALLALRRHRLNSREVWWFAAGLLAALLIFCGFLRWQLWHARLHLPLLVLSAGIVGLLPDVLDRRITRVLAAALLLTMLPVFYFNQSKPLVQDWNIFNLPRREVMIIRKNLVVPYIEGVNYLLDERACHQLGLYLPDEEWEYPVWALYKAAGLTEFRIEHVGVENRSADLPRSAFQPCAVFATRPLAAGESAQLNGAHYRLGWQLDPIWIYVRE
ncbi:MAG: hypothetical protein ROW48_17565 [Bellilinea sp.]|jgi:4-amino-4-deoxy-L-arabinose transferase-like glycosyltransferase